ncbi:MAG TPA: PilZ domain-containing protein [Polyangiaceae bacterium]|jgi:hypothetical protein
MAELRSAARVLLDIPVVLTPEGGHARHPGRAKDLSLGGMFVETTVLLPFQASVFVHLALPLSPHPLVLPAVVRWSSPAGLGLQFGLMGARETYVIMQLARRTPSCPPPPRRETEGGGRASNTPTP